MRLVKTPLGGYQAENDPGEIGMGSERRTSVSDADGAILADGALNKVALEYGTGLGVSTRYILGTAKMLVSIDPDPWVHQNVWPDLKREYGERLMLHDALPGGVYRFGFVFIDGNHERESFKANYLEAMENSIPDPVVMAHDSYLQGVAEAISDLELKCIRFGTPAYLALLLPKK